MQCVPNPLRSYAPHFGAYALRVSLWQTLRLSYTYSLGEGVRFICECFFTPLAGNRWLELLNIQRLTLNLKHELLNVVELMPEVFAEP